MPEITPDFLSGARTKTINVKKGKRSSRFQVDLPDLARQRAARQAEREEPALKKITKKWFRKFNPGMAAKEKNELEAGFRLIGETLSARLAAAKRLAFYPLWRLFFIIFKGVLKISYYLGYLALYILRLTAAVFKYSASAAMAGVKRRQARAARRKELKERAIRNFLENAKGNKAAVAFELADQTEQVVEREKIFKKTLNYIAKKLKPRAAKRVEREAGQAEGRPAFSARGWQFKKANIAPALYFMVALMAFTLPLKALTYYQGLSALKGRVRGASEAAVSRIGRAAREAGKEDYGQAGNDFLSASNDFSRARAELGDISGFLAVLSQVAPSSRVKLAAQAEKILKAGEISSLMGAKISAIMDLFNNDSASAAKIIGCLPARAEELAGLAKELDAVVGAVDESALPPEYVDIFKQIKEKAGLLNGSLGELKEIISLAGDILGYNTDKRYLLVFQNNAELRASGGFIGSYALIDFHKGEIKKLEVPGGGSYDTEAGLYDMVKSPAPLSLISPRWYFWDANWWPDWPMSAEKLMWFYEKSNGPTVDGVIGLTPTVMEKLLKIVGEIDLRAEYGVKINSDNFWNVTQTMAEEKPKTAMMASGTPIETARSEPKKIIGDLFSELIKELPKRLDKSMILRFISEFEKLGRQKHILLYFTDPDIEKTVRGFGWGGEVADTAWDYLMVVNTNIAGAKSDREIVETIDHLSEVGADGAIINTVTIKRIHAGRKGEEFTGVRNVDWMRIYVPQGSELISARGFKKPHGRYFEAPDPEWQDDPDVARLEGQAETDEESGTLVYEAFNKTVFANWSMIDPGEIGTIVIKYKLPFKFRPPEENSGDWRMRLIKELNPERANLVPYALYAQKQPGSIASFFHSKLIVPDNYKTSWEYGPGIESAAGGWEIKSRLDTDKFWALIFNASN